MEQVQRRLWKATHLSTGRRSHSPRFMFRRSLVGAAQWPGPGQKQSQCGQPVTCGATLKFLIDECLHTSLVQVAQASGYVTDHVTYRSPGGLKDWQLLPVIREREFTFVTNNGADFLAHFGKEPLHQGMIIIVPNVTPVLH